MKVLLLLFALGLATLSAATDPVAPKETASKVMVTFNSDGATYVQITNVKMLGKVLSQTVSVPPGRYVGRVLEIQPGSAPITVSVVCTEMNPALQGRPGR